MQKVIKTNVLSVKGLNFLSPTQNFEFFPLDLDNLWLYPVDHNTFLIERFPLIRGTSSVPLYDKLFLNERKNMRNKMC